jgi:hypothetical protein
MTSTVIFCYLYRDKESVRLTDNSYDARILWGRFVNSVDNPVAGGPLLNFMRHLYRVYKCRLYDGGAVVQFPLGTSDFLLSTPSRPALEHAQPPMQRVSEAVSAEVNQRGRESDHSLPSSTKAKNGSVIPPLSHTSS